WSHPGSMKVLKAFAIEKKKRGNDMKRWVSVSFMILLALALLAACSSNSASEGNTNDTNSNQGAAESTADKTTSSNPTNLLLWMPPFGTEDTLDKEMWAKAIAPFEQEH